MTLSVLLIFQLLIKLEDYRLVETVGIPVKDDKGSVRLTACVFLTCDLSVTG